MNPKFVGVVLLASTILVHGSAKGADIVRPLLVVRTYQATQIRVADWDVAVRETTGILDAAGIDVHWLQCGDAASRADSQPARCAMPFQRNEVAIRIVQMRTSATRTELPLGEALLDGSLRSGVLATIYLDRVECLARAGGVSTSMLLGRAIAHELGHLLLGTSAHSPRGLMRPVWTRDELVRRRAADWMIPADESAMMRLAYDRRTQPPVAGARGTE